MEKYRDRFTPIISRLKKIAIQVEAEPNFYTLSSYALYENPVSDLMALFMGKNPHIPAYLTRALLNLFGDNRYTDDLVNITVLREAMTDTGARLDIIINHDEFVIGIENKVFSDINNPFSDYEERLNSLLYKSDGSHKTLYKCILKPASNQASPSHCDWNVITYKELVDSAKQTLGLDTINTPFSKWQHFYQEFLSYLSTIGEKNMAHELEPEDINFTTENYGTLLKVNELFQRYAETIHNKAATILADTLKTDLPIQQYTESWRNNFKPLFLVPTEWKDKAAIAIVYYPDENQQLLFYINGYFYSDDRSKLEAIRKIAENQIEQKSFIKSACLEDRLIKYESKDTSLVLSFWRLNRNMDGALNAIPDMANWINQHLNML